MWPLPNEVTPGHHKATDSWQNGSHRLGDALDNAGWLNPISVEDVPLDPAEDAYADLLLYGWRYHALDLQYERRTIMFGGSLLLAVTGLASLAANRRRRQAAHRHAAPQWRPLGSLRVVVTSGRLLVLHDGAWWPVWYSAVSLVESRPQCQTLDLYFTDDPPYRLSGVAAAALAVIVQNQLDRRPAAGST